MSPAAHEALLFLLVVALAFAPLVIFWMATRHRRQRYNRNTLPRSP